MKGNLAVRVSEVALRKYDHRQHRHHEALRTTQLKEEAEVTCRGTVQIEVIDDGVGMTPDQVKKVFYGWYLIQC